MLLRVVDVVAMTVTDGLASIVPMSTSGAGAGTGPHLLAPFGFLLILLLVGAVGYAFVQSNRDGDASPKHRSDPALETLRRRYATGEIDEEEFRTRREQLVR